MWSFPVGTEVILITSAAKARDYILGDSNPSEIRGVVTGTDGVVAGWVEVMWDNGHSNAYEEGTIEEYHPSVENE